MSLSNWYGARPRTGRNGCQFPAIAYQYRTNKPPVPRPPRQPKTGRDVVCGLRVGAIVELPSESRP